MYFSAISVFCTLCIALTPMVRARAQVQAPPDKSHWPVFYVALNGNDAWSGKLAAPNKAKTDGPFRTLPWAQAAVRPEIQTENRAKHTVTVQVRDGVYELAAPLTFGKTDAGTTVTPVLWESYPKEKAILSAGQAIKNWKQTAPGHWETVVPDVKAGKWYFEQLYVYGERRYRPRLPKKGYYFIADDLPPSPASAGQGYDQFRFAPGDIKAKWHNLSDVQVLAFQTWTMARFPVAGVEETERTVSFAGRTPGMASYFRLPRGNRYLVENVREALTEPGEWYLDRKTGVLTYLAKSGDDPNTDGVTAPRFDHVLEISDAQNITFSGLGFAYSGWNTPPNGSNDPQAEINVPAAVRLNHAQNVSFTNCSVSGIGGYGISFENGCRDDAFVGGMIVDTGGGGVKIGETAIRPNVPDAEQTGRITIENNSIAHGGRIHPASVGIWIGQSAYNTISHNEIADFYYTGISPGWTWGYGKSGAHDNKISYNLIHDIGQGVLSDMGGIYTLGVSPNTLLDHNVIYDIESFDYGGWGIYFDEGTTGVLAQNNLAYHTKSAPFHQHYGRDNVVKNNIFAFGGEAQLMRTRAEDHLSFTLQNNIVLFGPNAPLLGSNWTGTPGVNFALDRNLYWNTGGADKVRFGADTWAQWQSKGADKNSLVADPLFVAPQSGDFRLRKGSPAAKIGFVPIITSGVGRLKQAAQERVWLPRAFPPPPPPLPVADDWEDLPVGAKPGGTSVQVYEDTSGVSAAQPSAPVMRVSDEAAFGGSKHSLKVTDAAGQKFGYTPFLVYQPKREFGIGENSVGTFAFRREAGAVFFHEWRDSNSGSGYHVGPSLRVGADGQVSAGVKPLPLVLPVGAWAKFEIYCVMGSGHYDLTITVQGGAKQVFPKLPCVSGDAFSQVRWWGFVADGNGPGVFYLDDLSLLQK